MGSYAPKIILERPSGPLPGISFEPSRRPPRLIYWNHNDFNLWKDQTLSHKILLWMQISGIFGLLLGIKFKFLKHCFKNIKTCMVASKKRRAAFERIVFFLKKSVFWKRLYLKKTVFCSCYLKINLTIELSVVDLV